MIKLLFFLFQSESSTTTTQDDSTTTYETPQTTKAPSYTVWKIAVTVLSGKRLCLIHVTVLYHSVRCSSEFYLNRFLIVATMKQCQ